MSWRVHVNEKQGGHVLTEIDTAKQFPLASSAVGSLRYGSRADVKKVINHYAAAHTLPLATTADEDRVRQDVGGIPYQQPADAR